MRKDVCLENKKIDSKAMCVSDIGIWALKLIYGGWIGYNILNFPKNLHEWKAKQYLYW